MNKKTKEVKAPRSLPMARINTRIEQAQHKFIKAEAKKTGKTEGEVFREILKKYININK